MTKHFSTGQKHIVIVEDDPLLARALLQMLTEAGCRAEIAPTAAEGMAAAEGSADLLLVDIGLPDGEGLQVCRKARESGQMPVIFLTARDEEEMMMEAFDCGADDYLVKPFPFQVLLKHIEAVLRRTGGEKAQLFYRELFIDFDRKEVRLAEEPVRLTAREYEVLALLARNRNRVVTRAMMLEQVWDAEGAFVEENTVNVTLNRLKKKIEPDPKHPVYIRNVFGMGYTFGE